MKTLADPVLDGIETELRGIQHLDGAIAASRWWAKSFAHKCPDYYYDIVQERIVRR